MNIISDKSFTNTSHPVGAESFKDTNLKKVQRVVFRAVFWLAWTFTTALALATVIPAVVVITQKVRSHAKFNGTIQTLAKKRYTAVHSASTRKKMSIEKSDLLKLSGSDAERTELFNHVSSLFSKVQRERPPSSGVHAYMQAFRSELNRAVSLPIYQRNRGSGDNHFIKFLQVITHALISASPGMGPMRAFGREVVGEIKGDIDYGKLSKILKKSVKDQTIFKKNRCYQRLFWTYVHPNKFLTSSLDHMGLTDPLEYNSYEHGNASVEVGKFEAQKGKSVVTTSTFSLVLAPTFVADRLTEVDRDYGAKRIVQDLEATYSGNRGEKGRVVEKARISDGEKLIHLNTPINLKNGTGPDVGLSEDLSTCLNTLFEGNHLEPKRCKRAERLAAVSLKAIATMIEQPFGEGDFHLNQSCKQNIDRGVVVNVMTILLADMIRGRPLDENRVHELVGMVLMRAGMVDDRAILGKWLQPLTDLLDVIQEKKGSFRYDIFAHFFKRGGCSIAFKASDQ